MLPPEKSRSAVLEQFTNEMNELLCKDLRANLCREIVAGGSRTQVLCFARR
jgi:hypothetical protein